MADYQKRGPCYSFQPQRGIRKLTEEPFARPASSLTGKRARIFLAFRRNNIDPSGRARLHHIFDSDGVTRLSVCLTASLRQIPPFSWKG
jgi:hypothetical protein